MLINIRGTNGSGKTTLAREFIAPNAETLTLFEYTDDKGRLKPVKGTLSEIDGKRYMVIGSYERPQGGLDGISTFALQMDAIRAATNVGTYAKDYGVNHVIFEGIMCATTFGAWGNFMLGARDMGLQPMVAYLSTPLNVCLERIKERQKRAGKEREIKTDLVQNKIKMIDSTRRKFEALGIPVCVLGCDFPLVELKQAALNFYGEHL